jgi:hypothetical protein
VSNDHRAMGEIGVLHAQLQPLCPLMCPWPASTAWLRWSSAGFWARTTARCSQNTWTPIWRTSNSRLFYRLLQQAVATAPVTYEDVVQAGAAGRQRANITG